ncbi:MAG: hypothetical protein WCM76_15090 [Bacteroidota bacterium]
MNKLITIDEIILFAYNEISDKQERTLISEAIKADNELYDAYLSIMETKNQLDSDAPSDLSVRFIIDYSNALSLAPSERFGNIPVLMN